MGELPEKLQAAFDRADLQRDYMRAFYDYWNAARGAAALPPLSAIDPTRLPLEALPYIAVMEVLPATSGLRFRSRLVGTRLVEAFGKDQTGLYTDEIPGTSDQCCRMAWCVATRLPYLVEETITFTPRGYKHYQALGLPFGDDAQGVQRIVFAFAFQDSKTDRARSWF